MRNILVQLSMTIVASATLLLVSCGEGAIEEPELVAPSLTEASEITSTSFSVDWDFVEGADAYQVDLAKDEAFTDFVSPYQESRQSFSEVRLTDLEAGTTYYFRARSIFRDSFSQYSNTLEVTTLTANDSEPGTSLKNSADFSVGMAVQVARLNGQHEEVLQREFNQITSEYEMKMNIMYPSESNFDFSRADATVDWALANGIEVHGHALIWHNATPGWVENYSGTDEAFEALIEDYIKTTVTRYKGKVKSWDVVNEAFEDNSGTLRNSVFRQKMGDDYLEKCHRWTREADPDVLIFYNDYSMVIDPTKRRATIAMVEDFLDRGVPIDGVGYQMHISHDFPTKASIEAAAGEVTDLGLLLHFSELDVRANPNNDLQALTTQRAVSQQAKVREVVEVYNAIPETSKFGITIWGMKDDETWLTDFWGHPDWPLLYNADFSPKRAHTGFLEGLQ